LEYLVVNIVLIIVEGEKIREVMQVLKIRGFKKMKEE
jgi:hypothetical protein